MAADLDIRKEARKRNRGVQSRKTAKRRRTALKEKENRVNDDDETNNDGAEMGDDADGIMRRRRRVTMRMKSKKKKMRMRLLNRAMKKTLVIITEVGFDLDEDEKDDMQFVPLARTVTRFVEGR